MIAPTSKTNLCQFDALRFKDVLAEFSREILGGDPVLTIADGLNHDSWVVLSLEEAKALREWLNGTLGAVETATEPAVNALRKIASCQLTMSEVKEIARRGLDVKTEAVTRDTRPCKKDWCPNDAVPGGNACQDHAEKASDPLAPVFDALLAIEGEEPEAGDRAQDWQRGRLEAAAKIRAAISTKPGSGG